MAKIKLEYSAAEVMDILMAHLTEEYKIPTRSATMRFAPGVAVKKAQIQFDWTPEHGVTILIGDAEGTPYEPQFQIDTPEGVDGAL